MKDSNRAVPYHPVMSILCSILALAVSCCVTGCGAGENGPSEKEKIYEVVSGLADAAGEEDTFVALFDDEGAAPRDRRNDFARFSYQTVSIAIEGNTATAEVQIIQPLDDSVIATVPWKLKKQGETWRLLEASL